MGNSLKKYGKDTLYYGEGTEQITESKMCYACYNGQSVDILLYGMLPVGINIEKKVNHFVANDLRHIRGICISPEETYELKSDTCSYFNETNNKHLKDPNYVPSDIYICFNTKRELKDYYLDSQKKSEGILSKMLTEKNIPIVKKLLKKL